MTFQEMLNEINRHINEVPADMQNYKLIGKPAFLQKLVDSLLIDSDETKDAADKYHMVYHTRWNFMDERSNPTIILEANPHVSSPYHQLRIRTSIIGKWRNEKSILQFIRKKKKVSAARFSLVIDHAELINVSPDWTLQEFYADQFNEFEQICQQAVQSIKKIDSLIKTAGLDEVIETISALHKLEQLSGLSQRIDGDLEQTIFSETMRQKILRLDNHIAE